MGDFRLRHASYLASGGNTFSTDSAPSGLAAAPAAVSSATSSAKSGVSEVMQGRVSLAALDFLIILAVGFYWWTRGVQGGG